MYHDCRWLQPVCTHTCEQNYSIIHNHSGFLAYVCVCTYIPRDAVMTVTLSEVVLLFVGFLFTPKLPGSPLPVPKTSISFYYALPHCVNESLPVTKNLLLSLSLPFFTSVCNKAMWTQLTGGFLCVCVCVQGLDSFAAMPNSFRIPDGKMSSPVCSWRVVTPHNFWVCMKGGTEKRGRKKEEVGNPPRPPNPPLPPSYWPLSIVPAQLLWALSPNQSGYQRGQRSLVAFYGP